VTAVPSNLSGFVSVNLRSAWHDRRKKPGDDPWSSAGEALELPVSRSWLLDNSVPAGRSPRLYPEQCPWSRKADQLAAVSCQRAAGHDDGTLCTEGVHSGRNLGATSRAEAPSCVGTASPARCATRHPPVASMTAHPQLLTVVRLFAAVVVSQQPRAQTVQGSPSGDACANLVQPQSTDDGAATGQSATDTAKELQNPIGTSTRVPFQQPLWSSNWRDFSRRHIWRRRS
jgi:hypothetical protein